MALGAAGYILAGLSLGFSVYSATRKQKAREGQRLGDVNINSTQLGAPKLSCVGPQCRVPAHLFWLSPLIETRVREGGGKGGAGGGQIVYQYFVDMGVTFTDHPIEAIDKMWFDGKVVYEEGAQITLTNIDVDGVAITIHDPFFDPATGNTGQYTFHLEITSTDPAVDLSQFVSGRNITMSGWTVDPPDPLGASQNGSHFVVEAAGRLNSFTTFVRVSDPTKVPDTDAVTGWFADEVGATVTLSQLPSAFSDKQFSSVAIYNGQANELPDALIEEYEGVGNVPGYRDHSKAVFQRVALQDYGNRPPNVEALIRERSECTVGEAIATILQRAGWNEGEYDVSALDDQEFKGYVYDSRQFTHEVLAPILIAFNIVVREERGVLVFEDRAAVTSVTIDPLKLAAHELGDDAPRLVQLSPRKDERTLPERVEFTFINPAKDYQADDRRYVRDDARSTSVEEVEVPIVMAPGDAYSAAARIMWAAVANRERPVIHLPPSYAGLVRENMRLAFQAHSVIWSILTQKVSRGADNFLLVVEGVTEYQEAFDQDLPPSPAEEPSESSQATQNPFRDAPQIWLEMMELPAMREQDINEPGLYVAVNTTDPRMSFTGCVLHESLDGEAWQPVATIMQDATMGRATLTDDEQEVTPRYWDRLNVLRVEVPKRGLLQRVSPARCLAGENRAVWGLEIIGFVEATLVEQRGDGTNVYDLSQLLRGLQGTEVSMGTHDVNERFVMLRPGDVHFHKLAVGAMGSTRKYRAVAPGGSVWMAPEREFKFWGRTLEPLAPLFVSAVREADDDIVVTWTPRSRRITRAFPGHLEPEAERQTQVKITYRKTNPGPLLIKERNSALTTQMGLVADKVEIYTAAQQATDGFDPDDDVEITVQQMSETYGPGAKVIVSV